MSMTKPEQQYSYSDYLSWNDEERWELIEGYPQAISPAPSRLHQALSQIFSRDIGNYLKKKKCQLYHAPFDVRLAPPGTEDKDVTTVVQPDLVVVCDHHKLDERGCKGAPDLVIEILSPSTAKTDMVTKLQLYEKYGVREYWLVHPTDETIMIFRLNDAGRYGRYELLARGDQLNTAILPDFKLDLTALFDETGEV